MGHARLSAAIVGEFVGECLAGWNGSTLIAFAAGRPLPLRDESGIQVDGQMAWSFNTSGMYRARIAHDQPLIVGVYKDDP